MSNIYVQEPPTHGKILLVTSVGDIDVELWSKEAPLAARNFVQLCMEGYYDGTLFHRVVPNFIVQGGDPDGTGHGGASIYDKPFRDEFHSRLRFVRRGLVAMANDSPHSNGSQFFFTLAATPELNNKHTIFGRVAGDTIYNMLKLGEVEVDEDDRPIFQHKIIRTTILVNPYDDIVPRENVKKKAALEAAKEIELQSKATKNFKLLSFGEEAEDEEESMERVTGVRQAKGKSSHDLLNDKSLSSVPVTDDDGVKGERIADIKAVTENIREKLKRPKADEDDKLNAARKRLKLGDTKWAQNEAKAAAKQKESADEAEKKAEVPIIKKDVSDKMDQKADEIRAPTKTRKVATDREARTLALLAKFKTKLDTAKQEKPAAVVRKPSDDKTGDDDVDDDDDEGWMNHSLQFDEHNQRILDANIKELDRYDVIDPRNPLNERRREESKRAMKGKNDVKDKL